MHCQLADRIPVIDRHDLRPLFHFILSDPGFNRDLKLPVSHRRRPRTLHQKNDPDHPGKVKNRNLFFFAVTVPDGHPRFRLISRYPISANFFDARRKSPARFVKICGTTGTPALLLRQHIPHLLHAHSLLRSRCQKRCKIFVHTTEILVVQIPVRICCDSLQWGEI